jgi:nitrogen regulatory protein P-II 1
MTNINSFDTVNDDTATIVMMRLSNRDKRFTSLQTPGADNAPWERTTMTKVEAIIQVSKLDAVKDALHEVGVEGMTVFEARGHGRQKGHTEFYRGREYTVDLIPKVKLEIVLADEMVEKVVQAITTAARTGKIGDGKIFLSRIDEAIRIRNDERGDNVL